MKKRVTSIICYGFAVFWMIITVLPLIITFFSSLKNNSEISLGLFSLPLDLEVGKLYQGQ